MPFGLLNICKPSGPTSHDVVNGVRRGTGERQVGHAGTLDPLAEGVLVLALGPATRLTEYLSASIKQYEAGIILGLMTDTYDVQGRVIARQDILPSLTVSNVEDALSHFRGEIQQAPPAYSAIKLDGKAAYARARAGEVISIPMRTVTFHALSLIAFEPPLLRLSITCSAGTYIRSLAHDLGNLLGCGAALSRLTRVASGNFRIANAVSWVKLLSDFQDGSWQDHLLPPDLALADRPAITLDEPGMADWLHGRPVPLPGVTAEQVRVYNSQGEMVGIATGDPVRGVWLPRKVFLPGPSTDPDTLSMEGR